MAEPRYSSSDLPEFSTYPASPATDFSHDFRPERGFKAGNLDEPARRIGSAIGRIVNTVRTQQGLARDTGADIVERATEVAHTMNERAQEGLGQVRNKAAGAADKAIGRANEAISTAKERVVDFAQNVADRIAPDAPGQTAKDRVAFRTQQVLDRSRRDVRHVIHEYPLHVIAGFAAVGLGCGILLRAWRER